MAAEMLPCPSARKLPIRKMEFPVWSVPAMENAYVPLRLAVEYLPFGGGIGGGLPPPLQAAVRPATSSVAKRKSCVREVLPCALLVVFFIAHLPQIPAHWRCATSA